MRALIKPVAVAVALAFAAQPAQAGWKEMGKVTADIGKGAMTVTPDTVWNRWSSRPSANGEIWTKDGMPLNALTFIGKVASGETIYKDRKKTERPMPQYKSDMLLPDLADLFQSSFSIEYDITQFTVTEISPAKLGGVDGLKLTYDYALPGDRLQRQGEARIAVKGGELYVVNFAAPRLHYFGKDIAEVRGMMDRIVIK